MKYSFFLLLISVISAGAKAQILLTGTGSFSFSGYGPLRGKSLKVHYHIPAGSSDTMPVLMAFHGDERDGRAYLNDWISAADNSHFMVFAPEFSEADFPGGDAYNLGNIFVDGDNPTPQTQRPDSLWTFGIIEPLFNEIRRITNTKAETYAAFGHSAGAQFLTRFSLFTPENRLAFAVCANAGWYTIPQFSVGFPYGLGQSPASFSNTKIAFAKQLLVLLGMEDNNPNSPGLRHNQQADAQGLDRLARGRYFFSESQKIAQSQNTAFQWKLSEVEGVGHDHTLMAKSAIGAVLTAFEKPIPPLPDPKNPEISWSPAGIRISGLEENEPFEIHAFNLAGQPVWSTRGVFQLTKTMFWNPNVRGIYVLQLSPEKTKSMTIKILINQ